MNNQTDHDPARKIHLNKNVCFQHPFVWFNSSRGGEWIGMAFGEEINAFAGVENKFIFVSVILGLCIDRRKAVENLWSTMQTGQIDWNQV